jgi:aspartyl-tRNA synthetase
LQLKSSSEVSAQFLSETPVSVTGILRYRPESQRRDDVEAYELEVTSFYILNSVQFTLPFRPENVHEVNTATRAKYRYLELRNKTQSGYLRLRDKVVAECRKFMRNEGFLEIETPLLFKSTSEGAREFIVPTRRPGEVYALPQSPQQYKQILMASGIARYFQIAKCFRDEDLRADRQPEFTQVHSL